MSDDRPGGRDGSHVSLGVLGEKFPETGNYSPCMHDKDNRGQTTLSTSLHISQYSLPIPILKMAGTTY